MEVCYVTVHRASEGAIRSARTCLRHFTVNCYPLLCSFSFPSTSLPLWFTCDSGCLLQSPAGCLKAARLDGYCHCAPFGLNCSAVGPLRATTPMRTLRWVSASMRISHVRWGHHAILRGCCLAGPGAQASMHLELVQLVIIVVASGGGAESNSLDVGSQSRKWLEAERSGYWRSGRCDEAQGSYWKMARSFLTRLIGWQ